LEGEYPENGRMVLMIRKDGFEIKLVFSLK